jgi:hypothetical protein
MQAPNFHDKDNALWPLPERNRLIELRLLYQRKA